ncbi:hypothetical protein OO009_10985 [Flavobacteriaceae bacterium KMM 6897]|nr:hypothetical protein [Flavobacteriaceae bacterium KMM 6897]MEB8344848.1 hypothetical protein [Flavobacteriaceae bacterium KMM 6898]
MMISTELSVLGKLEANQFNNKKRLVEKRKALRAYWRSMLGTETDIGFFAHPEIGHIYIIGSLVPMFLYDVSGNKLGALSGGTYGILRGFGVGPEDTMDFLDKLDKGSYLIILRDYLGEMNRLKGLLNKLDNTG